MKLKAGGLLNTLGRISLAWIKTSEVDGGTKSWIGLMGVLDADDDGGETSL